ncbi:MAG: hypothetical protein WAO35_06645 [Terriglobia bacterium]
MRLNRIGEPSAEQAGDYVLEAQPIIKGSRPTAVAAAAVYPRPDILKPSLTHSKSSNPLRSPPQFN